LRAEYEAQLRSNKDELENLYDQKYADLKNQLKRTQSSLNSKIEEITTLQLKLETSSQHSNKFENEIANLLQKVKELQKKSDEDHARFAKMLDVRDSEIDGLMKEKSALMNDYQDLMDTKVALDNEIATYRKLLECEESR
jgi:lamin B